MFVVKIAATFLLAFSLWVQVASAAKSGKKKSKKGGDKMMMMTDMLIGHWVCPDKDDGSTITLQILKDMEFDNLYELQLTDTSWGTCLDDFDFNNGLGYARVSAVFNEELGRLVTIEDTIIQCFGGGFSDPPSFPTVDFADFYYWYDPVNDRLQSSDNVLTCMAVSRRYG